MIEIEKRSLLSKKEFERLQKFLEKNGTQLKSFRRFTLVYVQREDWIPGEKAGTDIKIRTSGQDSSLAIKHDMDEDGHIRDEFEYHFNTKEYFSMLKMLILLGYKRFIATISDRVIYKLNDLKITLDYHHTVDKYILEAEIEVTNDDSIAHQVALEKIDNFFKTTKLQILDNKDTASFLRELNMVRKYQFDFEEINFDDWKKEYQKLIHVF